MKQDQFILREQEFIQLDQLMKLLGWVESGAMAHQCIDSGLVQVDGIIEFRRRRKLRAGMKVAFESNAVVIK